MTKEDLKLLPTDTLVEELQNRFQEFIFAGRQTSVFQADDIVYRRKWKGEHVICVGLCNNLAYYLNDAQVKSGQPLPPGEG